MWLIALGTLPICLCTLSFHPAAPSPHSMEYEVEGCAYEQTYWTASEFQSVSTLLRRFIVVPRRPVESPSVLWLSDDWRTPGVCTNASCFLTSRKEQGPAMRRESPFIRSWLKTEVGSGKPPWHPGRQCSMSRPGVCCLLWEPETQGQFVLPDRTI